MDYNELAEKFPFLSCIKHGLNEYVGIVQNQDDFVTSIYVYEEIPSESLRTEFLRLGDVWWWESNRMIPINIFLRNEMEFFRYSLITMNSKDVRVTIGPCVNLNNLAVKRVKRKNVQLVKTPKN